MTKIHCCHTEHKLLAILALTCLCGIAKAQSISFSASTPASGSNTIWGVATGDFNHDGKQDIVVVNQGANSFSYLQGLGNGTFAAPVTFSASASGALPSAIVAADFNNDGNLDVAIVHPTTTSQGFGNAVTVHLGDGKGSFASPGIVFFTGGTDTALVVGDFNEDGIPDLAVASCDAGAIYIHQGNGDGTFTQIGSLPVAQCGGTATLAVQVADLNRDNHLDIIASTLGDNQAVSVFLGNGDGTFGPKNRFPIVGNYPAAIAVGDFNGDGNPDLAVTNYNDSTVSVLLGDGQGGLTSSGAFPCGPRPYDIIVSDVNRDGKQDLVAANSGGTGMSVLLGDGAGHFGAPLTFPGGSSPYSLATADFNGDSLPDIAVANSGSGNLTVFTNTLGHCVTSISPSSHKAISTGGTLTLSVTAAAGCGWAATAKLPWLGFPSGAAGTGSAKVNVSIAPNYGASRKGTVAVGSKRAVITQN
jgi:hypothetical protein